MLPYFSRKLFLVIFVLFSLSGCSYWSAKSNRSLISKGSVHDGMSKEELIKILGEPYKADHPTAGVELLFYEVDATAGSYCLQYTPIRLLDGKVSGWGDKFCKEPSPSLSADRIDPYLRQ